MQSNHDDDNDHPQPAPTAPCASPTTCASLDTQAAAPIPPSAPAQLEPIPED